VSTETLNIRRRSICAPWRAGGVALVPFAEAAPCTSYPTLEGKVGGQLIV
jgi:hypothetical protein